MWLVQSPPGEGKTRLLLELADDLADEGWMCGWVSAGYAAEAVDVAGRWQRPVLLIVDDADTRRDLADLLTALVRAGHPQVRVVAAAREFGGWWARLRAGLDREVLQQVPPGAWTRLQPLADSADSQRQLFDQAVRYFADWSDTTPPAAILTATDGPTPLVLVHAAAALAVHDQHTGPIDVDTALGRLFEIEQLWWHRHATRISPDLGHLGADILADAVTAAVLVGAGTPGAATAVLAHLPGLGGTRPELLRELALWLRGLYPHRTEDWLDPYLPGRLVEYYVADRLADRPALTTAIASAAIAADRGERVITALAHVARHTPTFHQTIIALISHDPAKLLPAAIRTARAGAGPIDRDIARAITDAAVQLTDDQLAALADTVSLRIQTLVHTAVALTSRRLNNATTDEIRAPLLTSLAIYLAQLGRWKEALAAAGEAVAIRRRLVVVNADAHEPDLARSLDSLAVRLSKLGRWEEALAAAGEAVAIRRRLVVVNADAHEPNLARSLHDLAVYLNELGRWEEALAAVEEAVAIHRRLVAANTDAYEFALAASLTNLAARLGELGRREEAVAAAEEAVAIHRRLVAANTDAYEFALAASLANLAVDLGKLGRWEHGLAAAKEAVAIRRRLVVVNADAHEPDLARSLTNLAVCLGELGRRKEALAAAEEAVAIRRRLVMVNADAHEPDLARSLTNLVACLGELGRRKEALAAAEEAVGIFRRLVMVNADAHEHGLARSLHNLAIDLGELGRREEAVAAAEEAVAIYRRLYRRWPEAVKDSLANAEEGLRERQVAAGRVPDEPAPPPLRT